MTFGHEEADQVDRRHVRQLPRQHHPDDARNESGEYIERIGGVEDERRERRGETVRDIHVEIVSAPVRVGVIELCVRRPDVRPQRRRQCLHKRNFREEELGDRRSAGLSVSPRRSRQYSARASI